MKLDRHNIKEIYQLSTDFNKFSWKTENMAKIGTHIERHDM